MYSIYQTGIRIYYLLLRLISPFNPRAQAWLKGREAQKKESPNIVSDGRKLIWFHASSLGEYEQGLPLIKGWKAENPDWFILLTFYSPSGYEQQKKNEYADKVLYLPRDTFAEMREFLDLTHPDIAVFIKYDIWPVVLRELRGRKVPVYLVASVFRKNQLFFRWYASWYLSVLKHFSAIFTQDENSKMLLISHGIKNVFVGGDTRIDRVIEISREDFEVEGMERFKGGSKIVVAGSSWPEEERLLKRFIDRNNYGMVKLILAPHDLSPDHISKIKNLFGDTLLTYGSFLKDPDLAKDKSVLLIDRIGLLSRLYRFGDIAFIGGGFGRGLHNVLEPAVYGLPVVFGPRYGKFVEAVELVRSGAGFSIRNYPEFESVLSELATNKNSLSSAGKGCRNFVENSKGGTGLIISHLMQNN